MTRIRTPSMTTFWTRPIGSGSDAPTNATAAKAINDRRNAGHFIPMYIGKREQTVRKFARPKSSYGTIDEEVERANALFCGGEHVSAVLIEQDRRCPEARIDDHLRPVFAAEQPERVFVMIVGDRAVF